MIYFNLDGKGMSNYHLTYNTTLANCLTISNYGMLCQQSSFDQDVITYDNISDIPASD